MVIPEVSFEVGGRDSEHRLPHDLAPAQPLISKRAAHEGKETIFFNGSQTPVESDEFAVEEECLAMSVTDTGFND